MEHRVSQLDNVYIFAVGKSIVDHTESTKEHAALCSVCGFLRGISTISTVSVWNGSYRGGATFEIKSNSIIFTILMFSQLIYNKNLVY